MNAIDATAGGRRRRNPDVAPSQAELYTGAADQLRADLKKSRPFVDGTIVRWTSVAVNGARFHYAAIYAGGYWYTTSQRDTQHIQKKMSHEDFIHYLHSHGYSVTDLGVAVAFEEVTL